MTSMGGRRRSRCWERRPSASASTVRGILGWGRTGGGLERPARTRDRHGPSRQRAAKDRMILPRFAEALGEVARQGRVLDERRGCGSHHPRRGAQRTLANPRRRRRDPDRPGDRADPERAYDPEGPMSHTAMVQPAWRRSCGGLRPARGAATDGDSSSSDLDQRMTLQPVAGNQERPGMRGGRVRRHRRHDPTARSAGSITGVEETLADEGDCGTPGGGCWTMRIPKSPSRT